MDQPDIRVGSLVEMNTDYENPGVALRARAWQHAHRGLLPLRVRVREKEHVILETRGGEVVHFGSTGDPRLHVSYVKIAPPVNT